MPEGLQARGSDVVRSSREFRPEIAACRSRPDRVVFIESGNTDGWIATDAVVDLSP